MLKFLSTISFCLLLASCSQNVKLMEVDILKVRDSKEVDKDAAMVRGDQKFALYGKIGKLERGQGIGQYYTVIRKDASSAAIVKFRYQQAATRSKELLKVVKMPAGQRKVTVKVAGNDYSEKGRVLAWRVELYQQSKLVASEQSYMW